MGDKNIELEKTNKELSSFAYVASHDLQEPLRKIQTFSDRVLQLEGSKFSGKGKDLFFRIQSAADRMRSLIQDLLAYSKANNVDGRFERTDLNQLFQGVVNELELKIEDKNAMVENLGLPMLDVIQFQFRQLFLNLLSNAIKFSRKGTRPHVIIKTERIKGQRVPDALDETADKNYYHITVSDNGIGFEPEFSDKIFEIFHRLHGRAEFEGSGIGLSICKKIVENHNGTMTAEGNLDRGATFHIYLPE